MERGGGCGRGEGGLRDARRTGALCDQYAGQARHPDRNRADQRLSSRAGGRVERLGLRRVGVQRRLYRRLRRSNQAAAGRCRSRPGSDSRPGRGGSDAEAPGDLSARPQGAGRPQDRAEPAHHGRRLGRPARALCHRRREDADPGDRDGQGRARRRHSAARGQNLQVSQGPTMFDVDSLDGDSGGFNLRDVWRVLYRWRWLIVAVTLVSVLAAFGLSLLTPPLYRAYFSLEVTQPQSELIARANTEPVVQQRDPTFLATQYGLLKSRSLTERVVRQLNLANAPSMAPSRLNLEQRERVAANVVQAHYLVNPVLGSRLINLSYVDKDPARAARIVNTFGDAFIASPLERKFGQTAYARQFLQTRLAATKKQ